MIRKIKENKNQILGVILVSISFCFCLISIYDIQKPKHIEEQKAESYIEETSVKDDADNIKNKDNRKNNNIQKKNEYFFILEIPKIGLQKGVYEYNSKNNTVEKGIELIEKSDTPDVKNGNLILASHRGNSSISYFNDLYKLKKNDEVYVYYKGYKYTYEIKDWYKQKKTGILTIKRNETKEVIVLITCVKSEKKQVIYIGELAKKEKY